MKILEFITDPGPLKRLIRQCWTDPSSKEYSASRMAFWCWVFVMAPINMKYGFMSWENWWKSLAVIAGVYGANSVSGAWANLGGAVKLPIIKGE